MELPGRNGVHLNWDSEEAEKGDIMGDAGEEVDRWRLAIFGASVHGWVGSNGVTRKEELLDLRRE
jgi:hypothetical protein